MLMIIAKKRTFYVETAFDSLISEECEEPEDSMEDRQEPLINSCLHPGLLQPRVWPLPEAGDLQEEETSSSVLPFSMMQGGQTREKGRANGI